MLQLLPDGAKAKVDDGMQLKATNIEMCLNGDMGTNCFYLQCLSSREGSAIDCFGYTCITTPSEQVYEKNTSIVFVCHGKQKKFIIFSKGCGGMRDSSPALPSYVMSPMYVVDVDVAIAIRLDPVP